MTATSFWAVIGLTAAGTLVLRLVPLFAHGRVRTPPGLERTLRFVPAASLAALVVPGSLVVGSGGSFHAEPARIIGIVVALVVAVKSRNMVLTLAVGMATLWTAQWLIGTLG